MRQPIRSVFVCLAVALTCAQGTASAALITFNDPDLEFLVRQQLAVDPGAGNVDDSNVVGFTTFLSTVNPSNVSDLTGIERCVDLVSFTLSFSTVSDLSPLAVLGNLKTLAMGQDPNLTNIGPVSTMTQLTSLRIFNTGGIADLSPVSSLVNLITLSVTDNAITNIDAISNLVSIQFLDIFQNNIGDIGSVANLTALRTINAFQNPFSDLTPLQGPNGLQTVNFQATGVNDLTPLLRNEFFTAGPTVDSHTINISANANITTANCPEIATFRCIGITVTTDVSGCSENATPIINSVTPAEVLEGDEVTLTGDFFHLVDTALINIDGQPVDNPIIVDANTITFNAPMHDPGSAEIQVAGGCLAQVTDTLTYKLLAASAVITGTVLDNMGAPVTCAMVVILGDETENRVPTDLDGNFQLLDLEVGLLDGLPLTDYELQVYGPGVNTEFVTLLRDTNFDSETGQALGADGQPGVDIVVTELMAGPGTSAAGRVIDLQIFDETEVAVALSGARIEAFEDGAPMVSPRVTFSCADGRFELAGLPTKVASNITLNVTAPEYEEQDGVEIPEDNSALEVIMIPKTIFPNVLTGLVLDADLATGIDSARVTVQPPSARLGLNLETADDGLYIVAVPDDGQYTIDVTAQDFIGQLKTTVVDAGTPISVVDFSLVPTDTGEGEGEGEGEGGGEPGGCSAGVADAPWSQVWGDGILAFTTLCLLALARRPQTEMKRQ